jgi:BirA family biotin operon repressor/biotin-[acetyl-CoA-carboxylase] ligase
MPDTIITHHYTLADTLIVHEHHLLLPSTQTRARALLETGSYCPTATSLLLVTAEQQSAGYGTRARPWLSFPGNLYASLALPLPATPALLFCLPLLVGYALLLSLQAHYSITAQIKWVNDLLIQGKKIAGVLCERVTLPSQEAHAACVLVGIGLNLQGDAASFACTLPHATALNLVLSTPVGTPAELLPTLLQELLAVKHAVLSVGLAPMLAQLETHLAYLQQVVTIQHNDSPSSQESVLVRGLASTGALLVERLDSAGAGRPPLIALHSGRILYQ